MGITDKVLYSHALLAYLARDHGDYKRAGNLYNEMLVILKEFEDPLMEREAYKGLGKLYYDLDVLDLSMEYFLKDLKLYEQGFHKPGEEPWMCGGIASMLSYEQ